MSKFVVHATWDDCAHLTAEAKNDLWNSIPPYQRDARSKGIPQLGSGAIYPVPESSYVVDPFDVPPGWSRSFGLDVGWNWTACVWIARDRENDIAYVYGEYMRGEASADVHAAAIRAKGAWIPGAIDPAANGRSQVDGQSLMSLYRNLGLKIIGADNDVSTGIEEVWVRLVSGRLKVMRNCQQLIGEMRLYRRNEKGRVVKEKDHMVDAMRYNIMTGLKVAKTKGETMPLPKAPPPPRSPHDWMG